MFILQKIFLFVHVTSAVGHGIWPLVTFDVMSNPPWKRVVLFSVHLKGMLMLLNLDVLNS